MCKMDITALFGSIALFSKTAEYTAEVEEDEVAAAVAVKQWQQPLWMVIKLFHCTISSPATTPLRREVERFIYYQWTRLTPPKTECPVPSTCSPGPETFHHIFCQLSGHLIKQGRMEGRCRS